MSAGDLVLLSPTKEGLQQHIDILYRFFQHWALPVNLIKTKTMVFQKSSSRQDHKYKFHLDTVAHKEHTKNYTYLGLDISAKGNFNKAENELRDKARRAFYDIKRNITFDIPIKMWQKKIMYRTHCQFFGRFPHHFPSIYSIS